MIDGRIYPKKEAPTAPVNARINPTSLNTTAINTTTPSAVAIILGAYNKFTRNLRGTVSRQGWGHRTRVVHSQLFTQRAVRSFVVAIRENFKQQWHQWHQRHRTVISTSSTAFFTSKRSAVTSATV